MADATPLISVILPVYNGAQYIREALESVLSQGYFPLEILAVDDGSTDDSASIIAGFGNRVRCLSQANSGPAAARNVGLSMCKGEYVTFIDADDIWPPGKIAAHISSFMKDPSADAVVGRVHFMKLSPNTRGTHDFVPFGQPSIGVNLGAGMYRRSVFERVGQFDPSLRQSEDVDFFMRMRELEIWLVLIPEVTLHYRIHDGNMTRERPAAHALFVSALKRSLDRRRQREATPAQDLPSLNKRGS